MNRAVAVEVSSTATNDAGIAWGGVGKVGFGGDRPIHVGFGPVASPGTVQNVVTSLSM